MIVFGFILNDEQVNAIWTLGYKRKDLLLFAKTGFGKSVIFQLPPFMLSPCGVIIIFMPFKLLQAKQKVMINQILNEKAVALTENNNTQSMQREIAHGNYTHIFTSPEITLSKKFKKNVLDNSYFANCLCLLIIDEIHLVEQWDKSFKPFYAKITKIRKKNFCYIPLIGVSATLTKKT